jgi:hypothetical protein
MTLNYATLREHALRKDLNSSRSFRGGSESRRLSGAARVLPTISDIRTMGNSRPNSAANGFKGFRPISSQLKAAAEVGKISASSIYSQQQLMSMRFPKMDKCYEDMARENQLQMLSGKEDSGVFRRTPKSRMNALALNERLDQLLIDMRVKMADEAVLSIARVEDGGQGGPEEANDESTAIGKKKEVSLELPHVFVNTKVYDVVLADFLAQATSKLERLHHELHRTKAQPTAPPRELEAPPADVEESIIQEEPVSEAPFELRDEPVIASATWAHAPPRARSPADVVVKEVYVGNEPQPEAPVSYNIGGSSSYTEAVPATVVNQTINQVVINHTTTERGGKQSTAEGNGEHDGKVTREQMLGSHSAIEREVESEEVPAETGTAKDTQTEEKVVTTNESNEKEAKVIAKSTEGAATATSKSTSKSNSVLTVSTRTLDRKTSGNAFQTGATNDTSDRIGMLEAEVAREAAEILELRAMLKSKTSTVAEKRRASLQIEEHEANQSSERHSSDHSVVVVDRDSGGGSGKGAGGGGGGGGSGGQNRRASTEETKTRTKLVLVPFHSKSHHDKETDGGGGESSATQEDKSRSTTSAVVESMGGEKGAHSKSSGGDGRDTHDDTHDSSKKDSKKGKKKRRESRSERASVESKDGQTQTDPGGYAGGGEGANGDGGGSMGKSKKRGGGGGGGSSSVGMAGAPNAPKKVQGLSKRKGYNKKGTKKSLINTCALIANIYEAMVQALVIDDRIGEKEHEDFPDFISNYLLTRFGVKKMAMGHMRDLITSVQAHRSVNLRCEMFAVLCGIEKKGKKGDKGKEDAGVLSLEYEKRRTIFFFQLLRKIIGCSQQSEMAKDKKSQQEKKKKKGESQAKIPDPKKGEIASRYSAVEDVLVQHSDVMMAVKLTFQAHCTETMLAEVETLTEAVEADKHNRKRCDLDKVRADSCW